MVCDMYFVNSVGVLDSGCGLLLVDVFVIVV